MGEAFEAGKLSTRRAYGAALAALGKDPRIVALDGDVSNSTFADYFISQPWLGAQIALWGGVAFVMGFVRGLKNNYAPFVALGLGTAGVYLGYQVVSEMLELQLEVGSSLVNPLLLSVTVLLTLMFVFWHPRRS